MEILKIIRVLGDKARVRILRLLCQEDLSVAELQEILGVGQSSISMQLAQLKQAGLVTSSRSGQKSIYRAAFAPRAQELIQEILEKSAEEIPECITDDEALALAVRRRKDLMRSHFDELAGRFGRNYVPGQSWKALSELLMRLLQPMVIADIGAGEAALALMLGQSSAHVIAVDSSEKMAEYGRDLVSRHGLAGVEYRVGDMENLPIEAESVDLALFHQSLHHAIHPDKAIAEAHRILRPGGRIAILDLLKHDVEAARELYADVWLGFSRVEMMKLLTGALFENADVSVADRTEGAPEFQTLLAIAQKPGK